MKSGRPITRRFFRIYQIEKENFIPDCVLQTLHSLRQKRSGKTFNRKAPKNRARHADNVKEGEIAYQNKDITGKILAEYFKGKSFRANELRLDNLFELADGTVALVDYESDYKEEEK